MVDSVRIRGIAASGLALTATAILLCQFPAIANADPAPSAIEFVIDRASIEDMMFRYYVALSSEDHSSLGQFFTEDGELDVDRNVFRGRDAIEKLYNGVRDPNLALGTRNNTFLTSPIITIHGDTAEMDAFYVVVLSDVVTAPPRLVEQGTDHSEFVKRDGHWLITKRIVVTYSAG